MDTINLTVANHKGNRCIALQFINKPMVNKCVRKVKGMQWSHTLRAWYMPCLRETVRQLEKETNGIALLQTNVLYHQLCQIKQQQQNDKLQTGQLDATSNNAAIKKEFAILQHITEQNIEALQNLIDLLKLKAYSPNTIRTYKNEFGIFLQTIKSRTAPSITPTN